MITRRRPSGTAATAIFALSTAQDFEDFRYAASLFDVPAQNHAELVLAWRAPQRGHLELPVLRIETRFPLGLFVAWSYWQPAARQWVYPAVELGAPPLPGGRSVDRAEGAVAGTVQLGGNDEFHGVRPWREGDSLRSVVWKQAARATHESEALWKLAPGSLSGKPGLAAVELFEAVRAGKVKAVWIACTNPVHSMPDIGQVREALQRAEYVVVQEAFADTDTVPYADALLPASTWGEKEGTVTNSERRISRVRAAVPPPGQARADWWIVREVARRIDTLFEIERCLHGQSAEERWGGRRHLSRPVVEALRANKHE